MPFTSNYFIIIISEVTNSIKIQRLVGEKKLLEQINAIELNTKALSKDLKDRKKRWRAFRSHIAELTNLGFDDFLNKKGSAGEVEFDHEGGQLNLVVQKVCSSELIITLQSFMPNILCLTHNSSCCLL